MKKNTFSVIIPTFNEADFIQECIDSLTSQLRKVDEIIVVDNNSSDDTVAIVRKNKGIKLLTEQKQGQLYARIHGFNTAKSDYLITIDADSRPDQNWLLEIEKATQAGHKAITSYVYTKDGRLPRLSSVLGRYLGVWSNYLFSGHHFMVGSNLVVARSVWDQIKSKLHHDVRMWEDLEISILSAKVGARPHLIRKDLVRVTARAADLKPAHLFRRLSGWPRTYFPYYKVAAFVSFFAFLFVFLVMVTMRYTINAGVKLKGSYEGW